jgi:Outer membrane protein beta-barrel domain
LRKHAFLFILNCLYVLVTYSQSSIELIPAAGNTFSDNINYQRCTGHIDPAFQFSFSFIYHPNPVFGLELTYTVENPTTYLNDPGNSSVKVYTLSQVNVQRLLTGLNISVPVKRFHPFLGCLLGFSYVTTTKAYDTNDLTEFTWSLQTGADYYFSSFMGVRLKLSMIQTPNISNNSAYFNVGKSGDNFPTFAVGDPSSANITQLNLSLGIIIHFQPKHGNKTSVNPQGN